MNNYNKGNDCDICENVFILEEKIMKLIMRLTNEYEFARYDKKDEWKDGYYYRLSQEIKDLKKLLKQEEE